MKFVRLSSILIVVGISAFLVYALSLYVSDWLVAIIMMFYCGALVHLGKETEQ